MTTTQVERSSTGWVPDDGTFGARLALIRQRMSWGNVKEAAEACGLPPESWRTWERDGVIPRRYPEIVEKIAEATGVDGDWLSRGTRSLKKASGTSNPFSRRTRSKVRVRRSSTRRPSTVLPTQRRPNLLRPPGQPIPV